ncbi:MAG TPA: hypothetical protein VFC73_00335 [Syntrophomonadaceae bacterium]|nr:hypothetical protein [Syntrophomonadaceae bacterium]
MDINIDNLKEGYARFNEETWLRKGQLDNINKSLLDKIERKKEIDEKIYLYRQVNRIYQLAADYARTKSKRTMESLVTNALGIVFPGDLEFNIDTEEKGEKTEAYFTVSSTYGGEHVVKTEPQESRGGGIVDIVSLALRVALLETSRPSSSGPLILDEPAKHVSQEYSQSIADFLYLVVNTFERQVIIVTHNSYLANSADKGFEVKIESGITNIITR